MSTDTTPADNQQLAHIFAVLQQPERVARSEEIEARARQAAAGLPAGSDVKAYYTELMSLHQADAEARTAGQPLPELPPIDQTQQGDPQWAGPSLPHPSEATSPEERADLDDGWDDYHHGIEPNQEQIEA